MDRVDLKKSRSAVTLLPVVLIVLVSVLLDLSVLFRYCGEVPLNRCTTKCFLFSPQNNRYCCTIFTITSIYNNQHEP